MKWIKYSFFFYGLLNTFSPMAYSFIQNPSSTFPLIWFFLIINCYILISIPNSSLRQIDNESFESSIVYSLNDRAFARNYNSISLLVLFDIFLDDSSSAHRVFLITISNIKYLASLNFFFTKKAFWNHKINIFPSHKNNFKIGYRQMD